MRFIVYFSSLINLVMQLNFYDEFLGPSNLKFPECPTDFRHFLSCKGPLP